ncbi:MAG: AAA family ATPase, partial [Agathobacter rectalis]|nr:AAA family ATPase [Agathobacter rectalis]
MITYVKMHNFMSFKDVLFDFRNGRKGAKKFISIYGENGSGKSNFVTCIDLLRKSIESFYMIGETGRIAEFAKEKDIPQEIVEMLVKSSNIQKYIESCRMIECDEATQVEYGFQTSGHEGYYIMSFKERFLYEKLYYFTGKQRGVLYEIDYTKENPKIDFSNKLFKSKKIELELRDEISKYWGKHTLLSIFNKEREEKNEEYIKESYLDYVFDIIDMLKDTTIHCKKSSSSGSEVNSYKPANVLRDLREGKIKKDKEDLLDRSERIIRDFFTQAYSDIKDVYYDRKIDSDVILYKLFVRKMIGGKIRTLSFDNESAGTQHIIDIIRSLLGAFCGVTVVYDEIDDGIHDLLLKNVLESMIDDITG